MADSPARDGDDFEWQEALREALVEVNPGRLTEKVARAEEVIFLRLQALRPSDIEERRALRDASDLLLSIKRETLKFPDWRPKQSLESEGL